MYTFDEIREIAVPIVKKYGVKSLSLFGLYARNEASEDSDLDFLMDKSELRDYFSIIL